jgi:hypothetical protein
MPVVGKILAVAIGHGESRVVTFAAGWAALL